MEVVVFVVFLINFRIVEEFNIVFGCYDFLILELNKWGG